MTSLVSARVGFKVHKTLILRPLSLPFALCAVITFCAQSPGRRTSASLCSGWPGSRITWWCRPTTWMGAAGKRLRWDSCRVATHAVTPDVGFSAHKSTLVWASEELRLFLAVEIWAEEQDGLDRPREFQRWIDAVVRNRARSETSSLSAYSSTALCLCSSLRINSVFTKWWATLGDTSISTSWKMYVRHVQRVKSEKNESRVVAVHACCVHQGLLVKGKATPVTSGKWEVIYIAKVTKDAMWVPRMSRQE